MAYSEMSDIIVLEKCEVLEFPESDVLPGKTEAKQYKSVEFISQVKVF